MLSNWTQGKVNWYRLVTNGRITTWDINKINDYVGFWCNRRLCIQCLCNRRTIPIILNKFSHKTVWTCKQEKDQYLTKCLQILQYQGARQTVQLVNQITFFWSNIDQYVQRLIQMAHSLPWRNNLPAYSNYYWTFTKSWSNKWCCWKVSGGKEWGFGYGKGDVLSFFLTFHCLMRLSFQTPSNRTQSLLLCEGILRRQRV